MAIRSNGEVKVCTFHVQFLCQSTSKQESKRYQQVLFLITSIYPVLLEVTDADFCIVCLDCIAEHHVSLDILRAIASHAIVGFVALPDK